MKKSILVLALALPVWAQTGSLAGPVMGMVPSGEGLRPILGVPGAATMGGVLTLPFTVTQTVAGPRYALIASSDGRVMVVRPDGLSTEIAGVSPAPSTLLLSAGGRAAGLYYADTRTLETVSGLPGAPVVEAVLDLSSLPAGAPALAVDESGTALAAVGGSLFLPVKGALAPVAAVGEVSAAAWSGRDAVLAGAGRLLLVRDPAGAAELSLIPGGEALLKPVAVAAAGGKYLAADEESAALLVTDGAGGSAWLPCGCAVAGLAPLNGNGLFRVTAADARPMWLLDAGADSPRLWFVPDGKEVRP